MRINYFCPYCRGILNPKGDIILAAQNSKHQSGLIFMHSDIGNYAIAKDASFKLEIGEQIRFYCPVCHAVLDLTGNPTLAHLLRINAEGKESVVAFSKVYGENATYHFSDEKVLSYGEHCLRFADPEWFL